MPIWRPGDGEGEWSDGDMPERGATRRVPDLRGAIVATGGELFAIGRPGDGDDRPAMPLVGQLRGGDGGHGWGGRGVGSRGGGGAAGSVGEAAGGKQQAQAAPERVPEGTMPVVSIS